MADENDEDRKTAESTRSRIRLAAKMGVALGVLLLFGDAGVSLYRMYPTFFTDHSWGLAGGLILIVFAALWSWSRLNDEAEKPAESSDDDPAEDDPALKWVNEEISSYGEYGLRYAKLYFWFKIPALIAASLVPVFALAPGNGTKWITAGLGVLIAVLEGVQQVARYHDNWVAGIATRDQLQLERALFRTNAGVYAKPPEGQTSSSLLAERASVGMTQEQGQWLKSRQDAKQDVPGKK